MSASSARESLEYLPTFARFPRALRRFLKRPLTLEVARTIAADRLACREANFLRIIEKSVYAYPASPYRALLRLAGCELGDLEPLVERDGVDQALKTLREAGVYVTYDEFRGRLPIVRGGTTIDVTSEDFDNPAARRDFQMTTGGSTGREMSVHQDLDYIAATFVPKLLMLDAWGVADLPAIHWQHILPGAGLRFVLQRASGGLAPEAWYSQQGWFDVKSWLKYDLATIYSLLWLNLLGCRVPIPAITKRSDAIVVARHVRRVLDERGRCLTYSGISAAVRIALAAAEAGLDLTGTTMRVGGEPITPAKLATVNAVGARVIPTYGAVETGPIGIGCPHARAADHMHLAADSTALITSPHRLESGQVVQAFNVTSLVDASPKVLLNYQIDDHGQVEDRRCGCPLHASGYTTSLHTVRSYSKLLSEGVTFASGDIQRILEEVLPARFGGTVLDYQLSEEEDRHGISRLQLVISPRVAIADEQEPIRVLLASLQESSARGDVTGNVWRQAGTLVVVRREPMVTTRGKQPVVHRRRAGGVAVKG